MRVGIVGGGGAGLAAAWLLEEEHEVTLCEGDDHLGGHASTVDVPVGPGGGRRIPVDVGSEFLAPTLHPVTLRLMRLTNVRLDAFPLTVTLCGTPRGRALLLPPVRRGRIGWSAFHPRTLALLLQLRRVIARAPDAPGLDGPAFTIEEALDAAGASAAFREELFYPLTLAGWCVDMDEFRDYSAYNVLRYLALGDPGGLTPAPWLEVAGGMRTYVAAVAGALSRTRVRLSAAAVSVRREGGCYRLALADGTAHEVDALVLATNARQARELLADLPAAADLRRVLGGVRYGETRIAIHSDARLMPPRRRDWSVVNIRFDGAHSQSTMWKGWRQTAAEGYVFKSWVTYEPSLPEPLHALLTFEHGKIDRGYFEAQRALAALQGRAGLWVAGVYAADIDSHEGAVRSAVAVAQGLSPGSARLRALTDGVPAV